MVGGNAAISSTGSNQRVRPSDVHEPCRAMLSTTTPTKVPNSAGSAMNSPIASPVGFSRVKSMPSAWMSIEPTTTPAAAPVVKRLNQVGPIRRGATSRYAPAPMIPKPAPSSSRL